MLKKEHILCKINSGRVKPQWISPEEPLLQQIAADITGVYRNGADFQLTANAIKELADNIISASELPKVSAGLNKLLWDRCDFHLTEDTDYTALRRELFQHSAAALAAGKLPPPPPENTDIYGDLPGFEKLLKIELPKPEELLKLYNLAQAQALLIYAESVTIQITDPDTAALRRVLKAVKFFRLLAQFKSVKRDTVEISVSGPYALFGPSVKYAVSLASLLPVIVNLPKWRLEATLRFRDRELKLKLDEKSHLESAKRAFAAYLPEEIRLYHKLFAEKSTGWQIIGNTPFLDAGNQEIIIPDLSFQNAVSGEIIHLELFHRWHGAQLDRRIQLLKNRPELPLILGIDRSLANEESLDEKFDSADPIRKRCWLFRDFPGVENTLRALKHTTGIGTGKLK
ncbi:MAG: DUF790 family protein [Lentisphaerae bacterium]|nr:DUF790 family protein [Lentisphaerota bacterium]